MLPVARHSGSIIPFGDPAFEHLTQYEKRLIRSGKTRAEAKQCREQVAEVIAAIRCESPWELEIRDGLAADRKAERHLRFFERQGHPIQAQIIKLTMWAHSGWCQARLERKSTELLVPRDRVLELLRERQNQGATEADLARLSPCNHVGELRRQGFNIKAVKETNDSWRYVLIEDGGKRPRKLVTQSQEYARVARAIENLGQPPELREAWRFSSSRARLYRHYENSLQESSASSDPTQAIESDFLRFAGRHLKRWTYLMAVAQTTAQQRKKKDIPDLARRLFETLRKRLTRSSTAKT
jgi:hypothetical protein